MYTFSTHFLHIFYIYLHHIVHFRTHLAHLYAPLYRIISSANVKITSFWKNFMRRKGIISLEELFILAIPHHTTSCRFASKCPHCVQSPSLVVSSRNLHYREQVYLNTVPKEQKNRSNPSQIRQKSTLKTHVFGLFCPSLSVIKALVGSKTCRYVQICVDNVQIYVNPHISS